MDTVGGVERALPRMPWPTAGVAATLGGVKAGARIGLAAAGGALVPLCFPPVGWWPFAVPAYALLIVAASGATARQAFWAGMVHGMLGYGLALWWMMGIFDGGALTLYAMMALFTGLFCLAWRLAAGPIRSAAGRVVVAAVLWTAIEFFRCELFVLRFPWITPGTALGATFLSPIVGAYGASFLVVLAAAALAHRTTAMPGLAVCAVVIGLGLWRPPPIDPPDDGGIVVTLVQGEVTSLHRFLDLTRTAAGDDPDLVVWPEYALPHDVRKDAQAFCALTNLCADMDVVLVVGTKTVAGPGPRDWRNTALVIDRDGVVGEHTKNRPVHFFNDGIPGRSMDPVPSRVGPVGTPVCFDCDYTEVVRRMVAGGAEWLAVPIYDEWSWSRAQHLQHAVLPRIRAAETARWVVCAASSGVTQRIDPHGNTHDRLPLEREGTLTGTIGRRTDRTFFVRIGWLFPWACVVGAVAMMGFAGANGWSSRYPRVTNPGDPAP